MIRLSVALCAALFATGAMAKDVVISQRGRTFEPTAVEVARGDTVTIENDDEFVHQVYIDSPDFSFDSDEQPPGKTLQIRFTKAGTFEVRCHIHPKMRLTVTVK